MFRVGLTGGIGSGKSTVAAMLADHGFVVIDADRVAREIVEPDQPALAEITARFGPQVLAADGTLDRPRLAAIVFEDDQARRDLEAITHPRIGQRIQALLDEAACQDPDGIVVLDHPLLVETGQARGLDAVVVVEAPTDVRVRRLVADRGMAERDAHARLATQAPDEERRAVATHVLVNDGDLAQLRAQVDAVAARLRLQAREHVTGR